MGLIYVYYLCTEMYLSLSLTLFLHTHADKALDFPKELRRKLEKGKKRVAGHIARRLLCSAVFTFIFPEKGLT